MTDRRWWLLAALVTELRRLRAQDLPHDLPGNPQLTADRFDRLLLTKYARRIFAIVSKTSIPLQAPIRYGSHREPHRQRGSLLDADHPSNGVPFPCRITFPTVDELDLTVRHLCKADAKAHFKVVTSATPRHPGARRQSPEANGLSSPKFVADDPALPMLDPGRGRTMTGRLWWHATDNHPEAGPGYPAAACIFSEDRKSARRARDLKGLRGRLQLDGHAGSPAWSPPPETRCPSWRSAELIPVASAYVSSNPASACCGRKA